MGAIDTFYAKTYIGILIKEDDLITRTEVLEEDGLVTRTEEEARWKPKVAQLLKGSPRFDIINDDARLEHLANTEQAPLGFRIMRVTADIDDDEKGFWIYGEKLCSINSNGWADANPSMLPMADIISNMEKIMKAAKELGITDRPPQMFMSLYSY